MYHPIPRSEEYEQHDDVADSGTYTRAESAAHPEPKPDTLHRPEWWRIPDVVPFDKAVAYRTVSWR